MTSTRSTFPKYCSAFDAFVLPPVLGKDDIVVQDGAVIRREPGRCFDRIPRDGGGEPPAFGVAFEPIQKPLTRFSWLFRYVAEARWNHASGSGLDKAGACSPFSWSSSTSGNGCCRSIHRLRCEIAC